MLERYAYFMQEVTMFVEHYILPKIKIELQVEEQNILYTVQDLGRNGLHEQLVEIRAIVSYC